MKFTLPEPMLTHEAREQSRGRGWMAELLIFIAVFIASAIVTGIIGAVALMFSPPFEEYMSEVSKAIAGGSTGIGDFDAVMQNFNTAMSEFLRSNTVQIVSLFLTAGTILGVIIYVRAIERRKLPTLGFRRRGAVREYITGLVIGAVMLMSAALICAACGTVRTFTIAPAFNSGTIVLFFFAFVIQGASEELLCRGYLAVSLSRRYSPGVSVAMTSLVFAAMHLGNAGIGPLAFLNLTLFGAFAGIYFFKRGNIWGIAAIHTAWNFVQGNIIGVSVSGGAEMETVWSMTFKPSTELITGGAFGLEGGLAVTVVLAISIAAVLASKSKEPAPYAKVENNGDDFDNEF